MMRSLNPSLLIILTLFSSSFCYDLKCARNESGGTDDLPVTVSCVVFDLVIRPGKPITSINGNTDLDALESYNELIISHQKVKFIPPNIATFFPQLEKLEISNSGLEWIEEADINEFTSLRELNLDNNNLAILVKGLFAFNTELETISIRDNKLIFVHHRIFYDLTNLQTIDLNGNLCTKSSYKQLYTSDRPTFLAEDPYGNRRYVEDFLESNCQSWEAAYDIYYTMSTEWYSDLHSESDKQIQGLTHQLKTCDRNLDAALTNFEQQKSLTSNIIYMNKLDDLPAINLSCENELCVAVDFKVSFANSSIQSELYKTQRIMSLKIYQQPTLFLPQNLDEHFPKLINLSVTESGLYEIDFTVFEGLDLSSLNLTGNRIHEIPVDTFADLNNLQVLDLSFNKINSLFDDTFTSLKSLQQLYLNNNYLTSIQIEIVRNLESLTGLYLQDNQLKFIGATVLTPLTSLESVDLLGNACINMSHPTSSLVDIEATIIDNCIAPIELSCKSYRIETNENVENISYCNVEDLLIEYPKTKISTIRNREQELLESVKIFFVDSQPIKFFPFQLSQHFPNLKRIAIQQSNLTALLPTDFDGFLALTEIVINNNNLSSISGGTFDTVPQLELLDLSSNGITTLPQDIFARLTRLHTLNLADNQIVRFMAEFLPRKNVIDIFRIDHNRLEFVEAKIIRYIRRAKLIDFTGNVCIDMQFDKIESKPRTLAELSGEIDLSCSAKD